MSMLTHHRSYMYSVQDILNNEEDITSLFFGILKEITQDSYTTSFKKSIGKVAERYGLRRNKNEILELKSWGNVCQNLSEHLFENLNSNYSR